MAPFGKPGFSQGDVKYLTWTWFHSIFLLVMWMVEWRTCMF